MFESYKTSIKVSAKTKLKREKQLKDINVSKLKEIINKMEDDDVKINYKIPQLVQHNLRDLIMNQHPNGLWGSKLPQEYKRSFKTDLEYLDYGCASLEHMCVNLNYMFKIVKHCKGDFKVYDILVTTPEELVTDEDLILCPCVAQFGDIIPRSQLCTRNDDISIKISDVYDPSKFWFYSLDAERELIDVMNKMQSFYTSTGQFYNIPSYQLRESLYCAAMYCEQMHRGVIVNIVPELVHMVKIFFIDYGTVDLVNVKHVYFLHTTFTELNAVAMRGRLAFVKPKGTNMPWPQASIIQFQKLVIDKGLYAQVQSICEETDTIVYNLVLRERCPLFLIHERLIDDEKAIHTNQEQDDMRSVPALLNNSQMMHLVPTFDELESGVAPNLYELSIMRSMNYPLDKLFKTYLKLKD